MNKNSAAYIESEKASKAETMQGKFEVMIDEQTKEKCLTGYDSKNKMKITLLFNAEATEETETMIITTLTQNFLKRVHKESA